MRLATAAALFTVLAGCSKSEAELKPEPATKTEPAASAAKAPVQGPLVLARGVRIVHAGAGADAAAVVRDERARARGDGRDLVVYVGATWCEPCQHFHRAAQNGELDAEFPNLTLLEFDLDEDRDRLTRAGYVSQFIPLFAMPGPDGRASDRKFEGSVKGSGAVANIAPRLRSLLRP
ncbi:MAG: thioredoxin family protein [Labilithrix sp.]|nr:thioredoxin family protein [Labilithrix sp.]